jgi:uncharacterized protein YgbK (DUF1537 family)
MTLALGCIADDYTGASDLANTLTRQGLRTIQTIGLPAPGLALPEADAIVVAFKSRSIPAAEAIALSREADRWLRAAGATHVLFKICSTFDSTDAGNIGPVTEALRADCGGGIVAVTPAFPGTGRTIFQGNLFVGAVPLNESPLKDHPLNPMHDANLVRVLAKQSAGSVGLVPISVVEAGVEALRQALADLAAAGHASAIIDAIFDRHLETIGAAVIDRPLSTGASGLGLGLARALVAQGRAKAAGDTAAARPAPAGHAAILAGSCSRATLEQIAVAEHAMPVLRLSAEQLVTNGATAAVEALAWARSRLEAGPVLIASSATPEAVVALQAQHGGMATGHAIEQALATIAEGLVHAGVGRLVVAGGETSGAVVDRLGLAAFLLGPEIAPGVPVLRTIGERDLVLALKSGNFGGPDFFARALTAMEQPL